MVMQTLCDSEILASATKFQQKMIKSTALLSKCQQCACVCSKLTGLETAGDMHDRCVKEGRH